jgi:folate-binding protein YgfZ
MTAVERMLEHGAALDLGVRTLLRFDGPDRVRYLNGQLTNDLREIPADSAIPSCVTDAKGHLLAEVRVFEHDDALWVEAPASLRESLSERLDRYLIADEVEWTDQSDHWHLVHGLGAPASMAGTLESGDSLTRQSDRLGPPGLDIWLPASNSTILDSLLDQLGALDSDRAETIRIAHGVPAWGAELTEGILPPEAGLDRTAISYTKGCYIGQEVISRIKSIGRVNRHLVRLQLDSIVDPTDLPGAELHDPETGKSAGTLTSVSPLIVEGDEYRNALGFRSRQAENASRLEVITPAGKLDIRVAS